MIIEDIFLGVFFFVEKKKIINASFYNHFVFVVLFMLFIPQRFCLSDDVYLWLHSVELYIYTKKRIKERYFLFMCKLLFFYL
jgi:hypothetical protein